MMSCRSRSSSPEVHAFALLNFFVSVSPSSFPCLTPRGVETGASYILSYICWRFPRTLSAAADPLAPGCGPIELDTLAAGSALAADCPLCLLFFARGRAVGPQHILELHNQVSYKPPSQRVVGLGCKKPQLIEPMMKIFCRQVHRKASPETKSGDGIMFPEVNNLVTSGGRRAVRTEPISPPHPRGRLAGDRRSGESDHRTAVSSRNQAQAGRCGGFQSCGGMRSAVAALARPIKLGK